MVWVPPWSSAWHCPQVTDCGGNSGDLSGVHGCGTGRLTVAYKGEDFLPSSASQSALSLPSMST